MDDYVLIADPSATDPRYSDESFEQDLILQSDAPCRYSQPTRAHLAPWQAKIAREMMMSQVARGLALADIASRLNISVNHFIKAFRETEGVAPYQWYMQRRIAQAMELLRDDTMSLSRIADACGFADQSHFTKAFARLLGVSPGRWRRQARSSVPGDDDKWQNVARQGRLDPR